MAHAQIVYTVEPFGQLPLTSSSNHKHGVFLSYLTQHFSYKHYILFLVL